MVDTCICIYEDYDDKGCRYCGFTVEILRKERDAYHAALVALKTQMIPGDHRLAIIEQAMAQYNSTWEKK